ncbi:hypothetical protein BCR44DRAFT_1429111 [Catenaria anguillulae PL171]|uniref:Uncharacterized protein n=1 Tax=Catenaria anguillulae PL171 TaxID=765915 RepID=A0A1Y2HUU0_9FUNG|nr:hypothetical protein BCR44DRAFT_1429111 [Catenaria anguillulae PL171]
MATAAQYYLSSSNGEQHPAETINVSLGRIKSELGNLAFQIRSSAMGKSHVDACMAILDGGSAKGLSVTFQLDAKVYSNRMTVTSRGSGFPGSKPVTMGAVTKVLPAALCTRGSVVSVAFEIPGNYPDAKLVVEQLIVTISTVSKATPCPTPTTSCSTMSLFHGTINVPHLCDCLLELADNTTLHASRAILAHASPNFFGTAFKRPEWNSPTETENAPSQDEDGGPPRVPMFHVKLELWSIKSVLPCLAHMYFGWLPTTSTILSVPAVHGDSESQEPPKVTVDTTAYLELRGLVEGVKEAMISVLRKK